MLWRPRFRKLPPVTITGRLITILLCSAFVLGALLAVSLVTIPAHAGENIWTWTGVSGDAWKIVTNPFSPGVVYALVDQIGIVRSSDGGSTWSEITPPGLSGTDINDLAIAYSAPNVLYITTDSGVYRTNDSGITWQHVAAESGAISVSPVDWREAYRIVGVGGTGTFLRVLMKTIDGGNTWTNVAEFPLSWTPNGAPFIAPSAPHIMIVRLLDGLGKSTDGGQSWSSLTTPFDYTNMVVFDPKNSDTIYVGTSSPGGWKSTDGGTTWTPLANGLQSSGWEFVIDPDNTQIIHAANGEAGVMESQDGGASWTPINTGIQGLYVRSVAIGSRDPLKVYAGIYGAGIWEMTRTTLQDYSITVNDGALFTNQTAVTLTLTAPPGTTEMIISNDGSFGDATWESFSTQRPWTITAYGEYVIPRVVYAKFKTYGQSSGLYQDDIVLDVTAPIGTIETTGTIGSLVSSDFSPSITILSSLTDTLTNTVYLPFVARNAHPGFTLVGLFLSATDDVSGVGKMLISNDAGFGDAQWEAYATEKNWWVPVMETTTVYVKFRDRAGNESAVYSDTVVP